MKVELHDQDVLLFPKPPLCKILGIQAEGRATRVPESCSILSFPIVGNSESGY